MAWWIFQNVVITTALAAVVAMVCRTGRIGPVARHALWVLVLVKFITPPLVVWPWAAPDPLGIAAIDARATAGQTNASIVAGPDAFPSRERDDAAVPSAVDDVASQIPGAPVAASVGGTARLWLIALWAAGSLCLFAIEGVRLVRLRRRMRISAAAPRDRAIERRVATLATRLGIRPIPVVILDEGASPVVWGFGRPVLLWPAELPAESTDACIDGLIVHELAHVKRGDHLVGWIELAAGIVWWWNPLFWFVRSALREQAELACDAWVISALPNGRRAYAESLLALSGAALRGASSPSTSMAAVGIRATSRRVLERRLVMIMKGRAPLRLPMVGLFCLALIGAATLPAWATAQQAPPPPPPPAPVVKQVPPPPPPVPVPVPADRFIRARVVGQTPPPPPPPPAGLAPRITIAPKTATIDYRVYVTRTTSLTAEGQQLVEAFDKDRAAIELEADRKMQARREAAVKALQDLQEQYTKAGKLDEAVAIRDYLRAGGPARKDEIVYIKR